MTDMLVKLYTLPALQPVLDDQARKGITVRRGLAPEKSFVLEWVRRHFSEFWVNECDVAYNSRPVTCWVAVEDGRLIGFGCYDTTAKGFFGPTGVGEAARGRGTGTALLLACLHDMRAQGYGYAIIGSAGPTDYYAKVVGAIPIPDSKPGIYGGMLRTSE
jgi:GNAT superfamily N-acetyltransferase